MTLKSAPANNAHAKKYRARLKILDDCYRQQHAEQGGSFHAFKQTIKAQHMCLAEQVRMASAKQLRKHLSENPQCKVSREIAKEFKYAKQCLTQV